MVQVMRTYSRTLRDRDEIESLFLETTGMKPGYLQLSAGAVGLGVSVVDLDGVSLIWTRGQGRARWRDQMTGDALHFGIAVQSAGPITSWGRRVDAHEVQVWMPGEETDLVLAGPNLTLDIGVDSALVEQLGWSLSGDSLRTARSRDLRRLVRVCSRATAATGTGMEWRERVLDAIEPVIRRWLDAASGEPAPPPRHYGLVCRADAVLEALGDPSSLEVDRLCRSLGVPRRTLFHAYRQVLGVGPRRYFELQRLEALRSRLKRAHADEATVTAIAAELGFSDLGRMAARYRERFGENPSQTLRAAL